MKPKIPIREALTEPALLGGALPGDSWLPHRALLIAAMGEPLTDQERELFTSATGREREPLERVEEGWAILGRRSGKTRAAGTLAAYVGCLCDHGYLASGERGVLPILASTAVQAGRAFMHTLGVLQHSPVLSELIIGDPTQDTIRLETGVDVEVRPANYRTIRGITAPLAICDEIAFWHVEGSANPDEEILNALRPALATAGGLLWVITSPYAQRGEAWKTFRRDYGPDGHRLVLVAKAPSRAFNPTLPQSLIDRAYERDAAAAGAEYGAEFRSDVEVLFSREVIERAIVPGRTEMAPQPGARCVAWTDPSGGSADSYTLAIAYQLGETAMLVKVLEAKPPFSPDAVTRQFAEVLKAYGVSRVTGDRYAGEWPRERWRAHGIEYQVADRTASEVYAELLPLVNAQRATLLDNARLTDQLVSLERRTSRTGRDLISHPPGGHDDLANAAAGALVLACSSGGGVKFKINPAVIAQLTGPSAPARVFL